MKITGVQCFSKSTAMLHFFNLQVSQLLMVIQWFRSAWEMTLWTGEWTYTQLYCLSIVGT